MPHRLHDCPALPCMTTDACPIGDGCHRHRGQTPCRESVWLDRRRKRVWHCRGGPGRRRLGQHGDGGGLQGDGVDCLNAVQTRAPGGLWGAMLPETKPDRGAQGVQGRSLACALAPAASHAALWRRARHAHAAHARLQTHPHRASCRSTSSWNSRWTPVPAEVAGLRSARGECRFSFFGFWWQDVPGGSGRCAVHPSDTWTHAL